MEFKIYLIDEHSNNYEAMFELFITYNINDLGLLKFKVIVNDERSDIYVSFSKNDILSFSQVYNRTWLEYCDFKFKNSFYLYSPGDFKKILDNLLVSSVRLITKNLRFTKKKVLYSITTFQR
jgi:hypothetical protein